MSKKVYCGDVEIGGGAPISIQSMTNVDTRDVKASVKQIEELRENGCDIVRLAVPDIEAADAFGAIKNLVKIPLVADIHFDYRLALAAIKNGADKVRINPGNIGDRDRIKAVVNAAKERNIPIRIGVNSGSLEQKIIEKYNGVTAEGLAESAMLNVQLLEDMNFDDIVVSLKSSNIVMNHATHKIIFGKTDHPLHIGLTEAGTVSKGKIKSAMALSALLLSGIGDTMRISLTGNPVNEVIFAKEILKNLGLRNSGINIVSCPTCGRTKVNLENIANSIEDGLTALSDERERAGKGQLTIAVMGCAVNGPGEAREADLGVACGDGKGLIFSKGKIIMSVPEKDISEEIIKLVRKL